MTRLWDWFGSAQDRLNFAVLALLLGTGIVWLYRIARFGVEPDATEFLLFLGTLVGAEGGRAIFKRATFKPEAAVLHQPPGAAPQAAAVATKEGHVAVSPVEPTP